MDSAAIATELGCKRKDWEWYQRTIMLARLSRTCDCTRYDATDARLTDFHKLSR